MEAQKITAIQGGAAPFSDKYSGDKSSVTLDGLDDLFKWASEMVADQEEPRVARAREQRLRRQVMETVQHIRQQQAVSAAAAENAYLSRRLVACMQKLQEYTQENATIKWMMVVQALAAQRIPALEEEIKRLKALELDISNAEACRLDLLDALSRLKIDRDFLDELLQANEEENQRLAALLGQERAELGRLKARKWWQIWWR